ncbi:DUF1810 domain-containing protein [Pedobacter sp.]|uniref:DUF1810 domain-containing protein n=1 Tax=Pedobacter sp. TaxID=1411316 RepID=UPI003BA9DAC6
MKKNNHLDRFIEAQQNQYDIALSEIKQGQKRSHWMWYIFPQIKGLGFSETAKYYAIQDEEEAENYLSHRILGNRLIEISNALLNLDQQDPHVIFGSPDDLKLKSSMTLFSTIPHSDPVFKAVLQKFFDGTKDLKTLRILDELENNPEK